MLPRPAKQALAVAMDACFCVVAVWLGFGLRVDEWGSFGSAQWWTVLWTIGLALPLFYVSGLYRPLFRFESGRALVQACLWFGLVYGLVFTVIGVPEVVPRSLGVLVPLLLFLTAGAARLSVRNWFNAMPARRQRNHALPQVLVYGAGDAGHQAAAALARSHQMVVRAFIDDSPSLKGTTLRGLPIFPSSRLEELVGKYAITDVLLAMPSIGPSRRAEIVRTIHALRLPLHVRTLPDLTDIAQGRIQIDHVRELDIQDLLGRASVAPDEKLLASKITGKVVLVTGAGGSIGSELCRQIVRLQPVALVLVEVSEFALYAIHHELAGLKESTGFRLVPILASVRDADYIRKILQTWQPDTIYHAAAYKHVPLVEDNPAEGIKNNTIGTLTMAQLAEECSVRDFVLISTDKAVRPTNVMGASKRLAEMILQALARQGAKTRFSMVRFGNVLGSSGSVVPLFRRQIRAGGPITVTHPEMTRYFMTIPEAAQLVIQASAMAEGGDVFLLDMGAPVKIMDLARRMVELSGMTIRDESNPDGDIELAITGLRPGEKLYEELLIGNNPLPTRHPSVMKGHEECPEWEELFAQLEELGGYLDINDVQRVRFLLQHLVPGYQPTVGTLGQGHLRRGSLPDSSGSYPAHPMVS
jgi:FlaA1/EpsC-like NDP-sugar epimerase